MAARDEAALEAARSFDAGLVERLREGQDAAFQELFARYRTLVYSIAVRLLNDRSDADDVCQEVFLAVHRRIGSLRAPEKPGPYPLTAVYLYGTEKSTLLGYTTNAVGRKEVRGGLGGASGRVLFTPVKQIRVR